MGTVTKGQRVRAPRPPVFYDVPHNAHGATCRYCGKAFVYFVAMPSGKKMPVNCHVEGGQYPISGQREGKGISHFIDCPGADKARRRKP